MSIKSRSSQGFTLVELIIVIVVIAVLSTIGVVGFNSIGTRAEESKLQSDINGAIKKIAVDMVDSETPPANADGLPKSEGVNYQYTQRYDNYRGEIYCITATSSKSGVKTYHSDNGSAPREGACPGHSIGAGSPSSQAAIATQKFNTFIANIKAHAQENGLTMADYSSESSEPAKRDNVLAANPGFSIDGSRLEDAGGYGYQIETGNFISTVSNQYTYAEVSRSAQGGGTSASTYLRPSDGLVLVPPIAYDASTTNYTMINATEYGLYLSLYMPYIANQLGVPVEQLDAVTIVDYFNNDVFGMDIFTSVSGGTGGPWVFGIDQDTFSTEPGLLGCQYNASNIGEGYVRIDNISC